VLVSQMLILCDVFSDEFVPIMLNILTISKHIYIM